MAMSNMPVYLQGSTATRSFVKGKQRRIWPAVPEIDSEFIVIELSFSANVTGIVNSHPISRYSANRDFVIRG